MARQTTMEREVLAGPMATLSASTHGPRPTSPGSPVEVVSPCTRGRQHDFEPDFNLDEGDLNEPEEEPPARMLLPPGTTLIVKDATRALYGVFYHNA